jgi:hypothetical protein
LTDPTILDTPDDPPEDGVEDDDLTPEGDPPGELPTDDYVGEGSDGTQEEDEQ